MSQITSINDPGLRIAGQFCLAATQHASVAMCHWTCGQVKLSLDEVVEASIEEAAACLDVGGDLSTMVVIGVDGAPGSQLILTFEEESGRQLAAALTGREFDPSAPWSDLEKSAVMETGNILGSAYLNELTRLTDRELRPSALYFCQDFAASVLEQALMTQAMTTDRVLVCRTRFEFNQQRVQWSVFFVPSEELLQMMSDAVHSL